MTIIGNLVTRFTADLTGIQQGVEQYGKQIGEAEAKTKDFERGLTAIRNSAVIAVGAVTAVAYGFYNFVRSSGEAAQQLKDLSLTTGMATDYLQDLNYIAIKSGTDIPIMTNGITQFTLSLSEANDETSEAARAFRTLGVDIKNATPQESFDKTIVALNAMTDQTEKARVAQDIFGRNWKVMVPFTEEYVNSIGKMNNNIKLNTDELNANADAWSTLQLNIKTGVDAANKLFADLQIGVQRYNDNYINAVREQVAAGKMTASQFRQLTGQDYEGQGDIGAGAGGRAGAPPEATTVPRELQANPFEGMSYTDAEKEYIKTITIPKLEAALENERKTGTAATIAEAALNLLKARQALTESETEAQEELNDAEQDYLDIAKKINEEKKSQATTTREFLMDMRAAGGDVAAQRSLSLSYNKSMLRSNDAIAGLGGDLRASAYKAIAAQRGDTDMLNSLSLSIDTVNLSKDYPLDAFIKDYEKTVAQKRRQMGVRA